MPVARPFRAFLRRDDGSATIEAVLWLPVFVYILALSVDASMAFFTHSRVLGVVQDINRSFALGRIETAAAAQTALLDRLAPSYGSEVQVTTTLSDGVIDTTVTVPMSKVLVLGVLPGWAISAISVQAYQYKEI